jgi:translation initiation factor 2B subunit (eIF-2B alpha/beta/delta family)
MAKKNLGDLLRQEAGKSTTLEVEPVQDVTTDELIEHNAETVEELIPLDMPNTSGSRPTSPTKAELEATVIELKSALEAAHQMQVSLQQQIADLLSEQKGSIEKRQKDGDQANLKKDLEEAKKAALQLAEANTKLVEEAKSLKKGKQSIQPQKYKGVDTGAVHFAQQHSEEPSDFAANTWLL